MLSITHPKQRIGKQMLECVMGNMPLTSPHRPECLPISCAAGTSARVPEEQAMPQQPIKHQVRNRYSDKVENGKKETAKLLRSAIAEIIVSY